MDDSIRRNTPLFSMSIVGKLTGLSARQIRYYEEHQLIHPERTNGNRRLFSFNDVERLLEIKKLLDKGVNLAGIKHVLGEKAQDERPIPVKIEPTKKQELSDDVLFKLMRRELFDPSKIGRTNLIQGELSRFFH
ncbi:MerR family transcriptional regulator [Tuberibacillus calidus]|jgi:MerR family glutamine synthetase transcriptional repressor|uniref:MerR family transcriptional regulator n=1 Tax=Tuberibacillus calidus TaxID=340097 RepID=UPI00040D0EBA|nr:MerR family transcriptional regulator [Tuberibacillus calidus]